MADTPRVTVPVDVVAACKGEQEHFEAWAKSARYDMSEHPLHYIFTDPRTDAARMGWNAALAYVRDAAEPLSAAPAPEGGAVDPLVRRLAYGYAIMHQAICHMAGTSGASGRWYYDKAKEVFGRVSPIHSITETSNPHVNGDYFSGLSDFLSAITPRQEAPAEAGEREAFEAWYCADAAVSGLNMTPKEIARLRDGDGYGKHRHTLNGKWDGWQARAALRAQPQAREEAQPVAWNGRGKCDCSDDTGLCPRCFPDPPSVAAPPAPEAEKLREAVEALERADRVIGWMSDYVGKMSPPADGLLELNQHWLFMQRDLATLQQEGR